METKEIQDMKLDLIAIESKVDEIDRFILSDVKPSLKQFNTVISQVNLIGIMLKISIPAIIGLYVYIIMSVQANLTSDKLIRKDIEYLKKVSTKLEMHMTREVESGSH